MIPSPHRTIAPAPNAFGPIASSPQLLLRLHTLHTLQLITSGLWGIFYYKEMREWPAVVCGAFAVWTVVGMVLLGQEKAPK